MKSFKFCVGLLIALTISLNPIKSYATEVEDVDQISNLESSTIKETQEAIIEEPKESIVESEYEEESNSATSSLEDIAEPTTEEIPEPNDESESTLDDIETLDVQTYPCQTECTLNHDHANEVCEINHYGTLLNWSSIPYDWQYNYDNSDACWYWGMWANGWCYKTPEGEFDIDVRHKVALYSDGEYLYFDLIQATVNGSNGLSFSLDFTVDGQNAKFQFSGFNPQATPGTHEMNLVHASGSISGQSVTDSEAYMYVKSNNINTEYELKIPLTELKRQNPNIDLDNINEISFSSGNVTYKPVTITGISTFPYVLAGLCLAGVGFTVYKRTKKKIVVKS